MKECLTDADLLELSAGSLASFEQRLAGIPGDLCAPFNEEARQLETELLTVYRVVVLCTRREDDLERVATWWRTMVRVCDEFGKRLSRLAVAHPACGAEQYYDRVLELRSKMSSPPDDAQLSGLAAAHIPQLAALYDRFANALDPFAPQRDQAETLFEQELARLYDDLPKPKPELNSFKRAVILRCRRHLKATERPASA